MSWVGVIAIVFLGAGSILYSIENEPQNLRGFELGHGPLCRLELGASSASNEEDSVAVMRKINSIRDQIDGRGVDNDPVEERGYGFKQCAEAEVAREIRGILRVGPGRNEGE